MGDPNGAVAQWILKELQDEAAGLSAHAHASRHKDPSFQRPQVILEMERCAQLLAGSGEVEVHAEVHV